MGCTARLSATASVDGSAVVAGNADAAVAAGGGFKVSKRMTYVDGKLEYEGTIKFNTDSDILQGEETFVILGELRDILRANPDVQLAVEGHTDSRASATHNRSLSQRRAVSVQAHLQAEGVAKERLAAQGFGEDQPQVAEPSECHDPPAERRTDSKCEDEYWRHNRRVVFRVTAGGESLRSASTSAEATKPTNEDDGADGADDEIRFRPGWFFYLGPGVAVLGKAYLNTLDNEDGAIDRNSGAGADAAEVEAQFFLGGGYLWLPTKRLMVAATLDVEASPITPVGVYSGNVRVGPSARVGVHGRRWLAYLRFTPGILGDRTGASLTLGPSLGVLGLITRRFAMGLETGPDFDRPSVGYIHFDAKLMFAFFFGQ